MEVLYSEDYMGHTIHIVPDHHPEDPREWSSDGSKMVCFHGRYKLGDPHDYNDPLVFLNSLIQELAPNTEDYYSIEEAEEALDKLPVHWLPLFLYDHSGITMNTTGFSCPWDSGRVGIIYVTYKDAEKHFHHKYPHPTHGQIADALDILRSEVKTYDHHIRGDVYGYRIYAADDENCENEIDSCWGFIGDYEHCLDAAKETLNHDAPAAV